MCGNVESPQNLVILGVPRAANANDEAHDLHVIVFEGRVRKEQLVVEEFVRASGFESEGGGVRRERHVDYEDGSQMFV
jgi:hypothetical protein